MFDTSNGNYIKSNLTLKIDGQYGDTVVVLLSHTVYFMLFFWSGLSHYTDRINSNGNKKNITVSQPMSINSSGQIKFSLK